MEIKRELRSNQLNKCVNFWLLRSADALDTFIPHECQDSCVCVWFFHDANCTKAPEKDHINFCVNWNICTNVQFNNRSKRQTITLWKATVRIFTTSFLDYHKVWERTVQVKYLKCEFLAHVQQQRCIHRAQRDSNHYRAMRKRLITSSYRTGQI